MSRVRAAIELLPLSGTEDLLAPHARFPGRARLSRSPNRLRSANRSRAFSRGARRPRPRISPSEKQA